jgi:hypothetical protein
LTIRFHYLTTFSVKELVKQQQTEMKLRDTHKERGGGSGETERRSLSNTQHDRNSAEDTDISAPHREAEMMARRRPTSQFQTPTATQTGKPQQLHQTSEYPHPTASGDSQGD